jgi:hypothetical protein
MLAAGCIVLWHLNVKRGAPCCPGRLLLFEQRNAAAAHAAEAALLHSCANSQLVALNANEGAQRN